MLTLTPQGRSVAAIVLAFTLLTGSLNRAMYVLAGLVDLHLDGRTGQTIFALLLVALSVAVLLCARGATGQEGWAGPLAQGAGVVALAGLAINVVYLLAVLIHGESAVFYSGGAHVFDAVS